MAEFIGERLGQWPLLMLVTLLRALGGVTASSEYAHSWKARADISCARPCPARRHDLLRLPGQVLRAAAAAATCAYPCPCVCRMLCRSMPAHPRLTVGRSPCATGCGTAVGWSTPRVPPPALNGTGDSALTELQANILGSITGSAAFGTNTAFAFGMGILVVVYGLGHISGQSASPRCRRPAAAAARNV